MRHSEARTHKVFEFIRQYIATNGFPPSIRDIAKGINMSAQSGVLLHLDRLEQWGWITRVPTISRSIRITKKD